MSAAQRCEPEAMLRRILGVVLSEDFCADARISGTAKKVDIKSRDQCLIALRIGDCGAAEARQIAIYIAQELRLWDEKT